MTEIETLAEYIRALSDFVMGSSVERWGHMGAMLTDAVLQAGIDYESVVYPRAKRLWETFPSAVTTSAFARLIEEHGAGPLLNWSGRKLQTLQELVRILVENGVETEDEFRTWLEKTGNVERLKEIKGLKNKTADYLQILVGSHSVAVDRHLFQFLKDAGVPKKTYKEAHQLISRAAALLGVESSVLDSSIWRYMSQRVKSRSKAPCSAS